eukprot:2773550-Alexandrium_andersonii.AAC.1
MAVAYWSRPQKAIAQSSAEAEVHALAEAFSESQYIVALWSFVTSKPAQLHLHTDSQAAQGILARQGCGK